MLEYVMGEIAKSKTTACFTGHRPDVLGGYDESAELNLAVKAWLHDAVGRLIAKGFDTFISGGALGVDQWAADAVLAYPEAKLIIALPFASYGSNWPPNSQERLKALCDKAFKVEVVCEGGYEAWKNHERNKFMVDRAGVVVAVWNNSGDGGTASCVRYAFGRGKDFLRFNPFTRAEEPVLSVPKRSKTSK